MPEFLLILRDIVLLRRGPQELPHSPRLLLTVTVATIVFSGLANALLGDAADMAMLRTAVGVGLSLGVLHLVLMTKQLQARFVQTALASVLVAAVAAVLLLPVLAMSGPLPTPETKPETVTGVQLLIMLVISAIGLWKFVVDAHILRHALEVRFVLALLIAFAMEFAVAVMLVALFGKSVAGA